MAVWSGVGLLGWLAVASTIGVGCAPRWPEPDSRPQPSDVPEICIGATAWSAGQLGRTVLFRARRAGDRLTLGVFVYWTTERPWGANWLTYTVLPALLLDATYTHFLFALPGLQRLIYGAGDVEGARITLQRDAGGLWSPTAALVDDAGHHDVALAPDEFVADDGRLVFLTAGWSHQLSAKGGRRFAREHGDLLSCYAAGALRPLDAETTRVFRLGSPHDPRRAPPAWRDPGGARPNTADFRQRGMSPSTGSTKVPDAGP